MIMVRISEGEEPQKVPLVYYDVEGERHVVGEAAIQIKNGEIIALGQIRDSVVPDLILKELIGGVNLEGFSIGPFRVPPAEEAARRLGPLSLKHREHITETNPNGEVRQCTDEICMNHTNTKQNLGHISMSICPGNVGSQR
jgi:hypothetical protein